MNDKFDGILRKLHIEHWKAIAAILIVFDIIAVNLSYLFSLWIRFDCRFRLIPDDYMRPFLIFAPIYTIFCVLVFARQRMYKTIWRFASYSELMRILIASAICFVFHTVGISFIQRMPMSYYIFGAVVQFVLVAGVRFSYRFFLLMDFKGGFRTVEREDNVLLIGAGSAGQMILRDVSHSKETTDRICCIVDDDPNKWNRYIDGVPIIGGRDRILSAIGEYNIKKIYVALPNSDVSAKRDILNICKETGCELKNLPGMYQLVNGEVSVSSMRSVKIEDLLGRESIKVNLDEIFNYLTGKVILVTGGGGSIGSELCRQIAAHKPGHLIILDIYENSAYEIEQELRTDYPGLNLTVLIGSIRDSRRINSVFETYHPQVVYHAAAHKHVPLMEDSPCEAIKNNAIGTYKTAHAALLNGCERFVLISTDKAVNPTNIMGASKRLCEMVIQAFNQLIRDGKVDMIPRLFQHEVDSEGVRVYRKIDTSSIKTEFVAVRFGNVLGSNGSVVPLFKKQIANGGPVTVTHPDIIRYFMTIPEAVSLVLQAGVYAHGGEIFVLDMGEPVRIDTLARNLIKLSGYKPDVDIKIVYTGLRPGEKLYEEKLMAEEGMQTTPNKMIHIGKPIEFDPEKFIDDLQELMAVCYENNDSIGEYVRKVVPTYSPCD
ncbi:MAG: polysaccharide biosynthesis protein [Lachnospiraceae bacterium]|nr:polysaccharide biosynthesis protein [Lachnospiraceae bacterium]